MILLYLIKLNININIINYILLSINLLKFKYIRFK